MNDYRVFDGRAHDRCFFSEGENIGFHPLFFVREVFLPVIMPG